MARVVLGFPMYGSEEFVGPVLESLLALDYDDFAIVACDDASPDRTFEIARGYAAADPRLVVERNAQRLGMIGNWNGVLERAYELFPEWEYFAWASDNDLREPSWIATLVRELDRDPAAALAYSRFGAIDEGVKVVPERQKWLFETRGIQSRRERLRATMEGLRAGPIMYGLHRRATLDRAGNVPEILLSDFIFLSHLSLYGTFLQAPEVLWYRDRRRTTGSSPSRQRAALFAKPPRLTYLPVSLQHTIWLTRRLVVENRGPAGMTRAEGAAVALAYLANWHWRLVRRGRDKLSKQHTKRVRRWRKRLQPYKHRALASPLGKRLSSRAR